MADDEARSDPAPATPHRGSPLDPVTIEATADPVGPVEEADSRGAEAASVDMSVREPSMAAGAADPASSRAAGEPPAGNRPRRSAMPTLLGLIGVILALLLGANLYTMYNPPGNGALDGVVARADALDRRVGELESRSGSAAELALRLKFVETDVAQLKSAAEAARQPAALASPPAPAPAPGGDDQVAALQARLADLARTVAGLQDAAAGPVTVDLGPLETKVAALAALVTAVQASLAALPRVDLAPVQAEVAALDRRLAPVEAAL